MSDPIERLLNIHSHFGAEQQSELISEIERVLTRKSSPSASNGNSTIKREVKHESISTVTNGDVMKSKERKGKNFMNLARYMYFDLSVTS